MMRCTAFFFLFTLFSRSFSSSSSFFSVFVLHLFLPFFAFYFLEYPMFSFSTGG